MCSSAHRHLIQAVSLYPAVPCICRALTKTTRWCALFGTARQLLPKLCGTPTGVRMPNLGRFLIWDKATFQGTLSCISTVYNAHTQHHLRTYTPNILPGRIVETPSLTSKCCDALIIIDIHNSIAIIILNIFCLAAMFVFGFFPIVGPSASLPCCFLCLQPTVSYKNTEVSQIRNLCKKIW